VYCNYTINVPAGSSGACPDGQNNATVHINYQYAKSALVNVYFSTTTPSNLVDKCVTLEDIFNVNVSTPAGKNNQLKKVFAYHLLRAHRISALYLLC
jgi:hypothetical protein